MEKVVSGKGMELGAGVLTDRDLLSGIAKGDDSALGILYDRHGPLTYAMVLRIVGIQEDAEEITADVFSQVWRSARQFNPERGSIGAWIVTIARSRALDKLRSRRRSARVVEQATVLGADSVAVSAGTAVPADRRAEQRELSDIVTRALSNLSDPQRRVIELAYYDGLSQSEIAEVLSEPLGTVKTRMRAAMVKLREFLSPSLGMEAT